MINCRKCGQPLNAGNIRVIRKPGKRAYRVHKVCPENQPRVEASQPEGFEASQVIEAKGVQVTEAKPSVNLEGPDPAPGYRFFVHPASAEKLWRAMGKGSGFASSWSVGITIEVIPVLEEVAEANPEAVAQFIEIKFKGD